MRVFNDFKLMNAIFVFIFILIVGVFISERPYSADEKYTTNFTEKMSTIDLIKGKAQEGCNSPLFYILQKPFKGLRFLSILFMSSAITLVFYFFSQKEDVLGFISLVMFLIPHITWQHLSEARPYALIVLLTVFQCLLYLRTASSRAIGLTHLALAFTFSLTWFQIIGMSILLWRSGRHKLSQYFFITVIPLLVIGYYGWIAPKYPFYLSFHHSYTGPGFPISNRYFIYLLPISIIALLNYLDKMYASTIRETT